MLKKSVSVELALLIIALFRSCEMPVIQIIEIIQISILV